MALNVDSLRILHYPDPRLRKKARPVERFDAELEALTRRMFELMYAAKGVGLAAPQVGVALRVFVMNPTAKPEDERVICNPKIRDGHSPAEAEEGCLSLPGIHVQVRRPASCRLLAQDVSGNPIEEEGSDLLCRIWQHETDHLDGVLILDKMSPADEIATRKTLRALEAEFTG